MGGWVGGWVGGWEEGFFSPFVLGRRRSANREEEACLGKGRAGEERYRL